MGKCAPLHILDFKTRISVLNWTAQTPMWGKMQLHPFGGAVQIPFSLPSTGSLGGLKSLRPSNMVSTSTQKHISFHRDLQIPLVSTLWLVVYSEFLFSALGQNFFDLCTDTVNP